VGRQYSAGGKSNLLGISKRGYKNFRRLLVQRARVYMLRLKYQHGVLADGVRSMFCRRHSNVVACAFASAGTNRVSDSGPSYAILSRARRFSSLTLLVVLYYASSFPALR
jgi:hypothetical protein